MAKDNSQNTPKSTIAKTDDGTIQITFTIPFDLIKEKRLEVAKSFSDKVNVPGFRQGKAPIEKVLEHVPENTLLQETLSKILPKLLGEAVDEHNIKPVIYPKFEVVKSNDDEDWQIRAITCEAPEFTLGNYKAEIKKAIPSKSAIWTPGKDDKEKKVKEPTREEKEESILKALVETVKITIPNILIQEEVDNRLSGLLSRLEKLGLTLESYLASTGKKPNSLRDEYKKQAEDALRIDFILTRIADEEKLGVDKKEVDASIDAAKNAENHDPNHEGHDHEHDFDTPERRRFIEVIIKRRKALDYLLTLA